MMKKRLAIFLAAFAFLAFAMPAQAQTTLYISGGGTFPTGDFGDYADTGWMIAGGALFGIGSPGLSAGIDLFYGSNNHGSDDIDLNSKTTPHGAMLIIDYAFGEPGAIRPYLFGGLGTLVHRFSSDFGSESEWQFGYEFGAGVAFPVGSTTSIYAEGRYMGASDTQYFAAMGGFAFGI